MKECSPAFHDLLFAFVDMLILSMDNLLEVLHILIEIGLKLLNFITIIAEHNGYVVPVYADLLSTFRAFLPCCIILNAIVFALQFR